ncbi:unnamed protein product [Adineta steineri]|uniref:Uncharacterized protein n=1 Tax=Adineta steineri TaxID=433720 RepID=A0A818MW32_9BILA|nr:unnamed protein product [Adineta steineri]CAF3595287.1 unnamed protein product [Adineta steineri]
MRIIYQTLFFLAYLTIFIHSQSGGNSDGGGGGSEGGGSLRRRIPPCKSDACPYSHYIIAGCVGGLVGLLLLIVGVLWCRKRCKGRPFRTNSNFVNKGTSKNSHENIYNGYQFQSGIWSTHYHQYCRWHGLFRCSLSFNSQLMKVSGSGVDHIGSFTIDGTYSNETRRIGLTKQYEIGTGDPSENFGHQATIQLTWNEKNNQFEGKWYVQTKKYHDEGKFQLKLREQQQLHPYEKV